MKLYSNIKTHETIVEFWGASTKHPDSMNCYQDDVKNGKYIPNEYQDEEYNILQWLMYVASMKTWCFHALECISEVLTIVKNSEPEIYKHWCHIR